MTEKIEWGKEESLKKSWDTSKSKSSDTATNKSDTTTKSILEPQYKKNFHNFLKLIYYNMSNIDKIKLYNDTKSNNPLSTIKIEDSELSKTDKEQIQLCLDKYEELVQIYEKSTKEQGTYLLNFFKDTDKLIMELVELDNGITPDEINKLHIDICNSSKDCKVGMDFIKNIYKVQLRSAKSIITLMNEHSKDLKVYTPSTNKISLEKIAKLFNDKIIEMDFLFDQDSKIAMKTVKGGYFPTMDNVNKYLEKKNNKYIVKHEMEKINKLLFNY